MSIATWKPLSPFSRVVAPAGLLRGGEGKFRACIPRRAGDEVTEAA